MDDARYILILRVRALSALSPGILFELCDGLCPEALSAVFDIISENEFQFTFWLADQLNQKLFDKRCAAFALELTSFELEACQADALSTALQQSYNDENRPEIVQCGMFTIHRLLKQPEDTEINTQNHDIVIWSPYAFGDGLHPTTALCLKALSKIKQESPSFVPSHILDVGCGSGILSVAAAKQYQNSVVFATDIEEESISSFYGNMTYNGIAKERFFAALDARLTDEKLIAAQPYKLIFANILKTPLLALAPQIHALQDVAGTLILSGFYRDQSKAVKESYENYGYHCIGETVQDDWVCLELEKG
jgi:ribosomal protein L11 methyltransferase